MQNSLFAADNGEELVSVARLGLDGVDHLMGYVPSHGAIPSAEMGALVRLLSASLSLGLALVNGSNGPSPDSDELQV